MRLTFESADSKADSCIQLIGSVNRRKDEVRVNSLSLPDCLNLDVSRVLAPELNSISIPRPLDVHWSHWFSWVCSLQMLIVGFFSPP
jgi:hypothetical protein